MADLASLRVSVDSREVKAATNDLNNLSRASGQAERAATGLSNAAKLFGGALAAAGVLGLVTSVAKANAEFQSLNASLKVATGSSVAATAAFNEIKKFAAETPYQLNQTVEAFLKLKNLGLDPSMAAMRSYGNTAASMGKSLNQMIEAVADASTNEFERLKEFGIKAKQEKDTVTFTFQGIATTVKKNSEEIQQYLMNIGNTQFAGAMDEQMKTLNGRMSNLKDSIDNLYVSIGNAGATNAFTKALDAASAAVTYLTNNLDAILKGIEVVMVAVAGMAAAFIALRAAMGVQAIVTYITQLIAMQFALGATTTASALAGAGIKGLQAILASTGWGLAVIAIGAVVGAIYSLATAQSRAREETNGHIASLKALAQSRSVDWAQKRGEQEIEARLLERDIRLIRERNAAQAVGQGKKIEYITPDLAAKRERLDALRIGIKEADVLKAQADAMAAIPVPAAAASAAIANTGKEAKKANDSLMDYYEGLVETGRYLGFNTEYEKEAAKARDAGRESLAADIIMQGKANDAKQLLIDNEKKRQDFIKGTLADLLFENTLIGKNTQEREQAIAVRALENAMFEKGAKEREEYLAAVAAGSEGKILDDQQKRIAALRQEIELMMLAPAAAAERAAVLEAERLGLQANTQAYKDFLAAAAQQAGLEKTRDGLKEIKDAMQEVKDMTFDIDLEGVFGNVSKALGGLLNVYEDFAKRQKSLALAMSEDNKNEASRKDAQRKSLRNEINLYGNLTASAKGFFKEKSTGYKVMQAAETAFRAVEIAMSLKSMAIKAKETVVSIANGAAKMFSQLGIYAFPVVAAMIGVMVALGASGGNVSQPAIPDAEAMQAQQGTGSVLGDSTAKSDSINRSLEIMAANSNSDLEYSNKMLTSLRSIQNSMAELSNNVAKQISVSGGMFDTSNQRLGTSGSGGFLGIGKTSTTRELQDLGIDIVSTSIAEIIAGGISGSTYQVIEQVKKKSGFLGIGGGTKTTYQTTTGNLDQDVRNSITGVIASLRQGLIDGADVIGLDGAQAILDSFQVNIGRISLAGLSGSEIEEQLNAVFSKVGDEMAGALFPTLTEMQRIGEGLFETFARVAREYQVVDVTLASIGKEFGAVGVSSLAARSALVQMFESLDQFVEQTNFFRDNFLTEAERIAPVTQAVAAELERLGLASITTIDQFKAAVLGLDLTTSAGQETYAALLQLAPAFKMVADYQAEIAKLQIDGAETSVESAKAALEIQKQRSSMEIQLMEAQGRASEALAAKRRLELAAMDASLRALQQSIYAAQDAAKTTSLQIQLMEEQGDAAGALAARRAQELAALSETDRAIQEQIYIQQDANKRAAELAAAREAAQQRAEAARAKAEQELQARLAAAAQLANDRRQLEIQLMELQGKTSEALAARRALELAGMDASLRALQKQIYAAEDAAKRAEAASQLASEKRSLEIELMEALGNSTGALAATRELELAGMDATLRGLQLQIYAANDAREASIAAAEAAAEAAEEQERIAEEALALARDRRSLEIELLEAQGFAIEALTLRRAMELEAIDESLRGIQEQIWAAQEKAEADALAAQAAEDATKALQDYADALANVSKTVVDEINRLRGINATSSSSLLKAQFATLTAQARTGNLDALGKLPELSRSIEEATLGTATSALEVARIRAWLATSLGETLAQQGSADVALSATSTGLTFDGNSTASANAEQTSGELSNMSNVLYNALYQVAKNTGKSYELMDRWDGDGLPDIREDASDYY